MLDHRWSPCRACRVARTPALRAPWKGHSIASAHISSAVPDLKEAGEDGSAVWLEKKSLSIGLMLATGAE